MDKSNKAIREDIEKLEQLERLKKEIENQQIPLVTEKYCPLCERVIHHSNFVISKYTRDKLGYHCTECQEAEEQRIFKINMASSNGGLTNE